MTDRAAALPAATAAPARLEDAEIRGFLRSIPALAALPLAGLAADFLAPEVVIPAGIAVFAVEQLYRSGKLATGLDALVDRGVLKQNQRDALLGAAARLDDALPLRAVDVALLAALAPELEALAPLVAKVPVLRPVAAAVRVVATLPAALPRVGHALASVAGRAL
jgi:hypothetical protein